MKRVWVEDLVGKNSISKIGDSIFALPFLNYLVQRDGSVEYGPAIHTWVSAALPKEFIVNTNLLRSDCDYILNTHEAWKYVVVHGNSTMHMINGFSFQSRLNVQLDLSFPFVKEIINHKVDIVIFPFGSQDARSEDRAWQQEKWIALIASLPSQFNKIVVGSGSEDYSWLDSSIQIASGKSLSYVAGLLDKCKLFISVDSGPSSLANVLGIKNHVLIYPHNCPITENVNAKKYQVGVNSKWPLVTSIPVAPVFDACFNCLKDFDYI